MEEYTMFLEHIDKLVERQQVVTRIYSWWFEQLRGLEDGLPGSSKLLNREYNGLYLKQRGRVRIGLTRYEARLTWLFTGV